MIGQVAIQRKRLLLIYTLWKNDQTFDPEYHLKKVAQPQKSQATRDSSNSELLLVYETTLSCFLLDI